jgi:hypothetical protein
MTMRFIPWEGREVPIFVELIHWAVMFVRYDRKIAGGPGASTWMTSGPR